MIDREGRVRSPVVLEGSLPGKIYLGIESMRVWRYKPAMLDGEPVAVYFPARGLLRGPSGLRPTTRGIRRGRYECWYFRISS